MSFLFCPKCGKEVASGAKFCSYCGAPLEDNGNAATPEQTEEQKQNEFQRFCHDENAQTVVNTNNGAVGTAGVGGVGSSVAPAVDCEIQKSEPVKVDTVSDGLMKEFLASCGVARRYNEKRLSLDKKSKIFGGIAIVLSLIAMLFEFLRSNAVDNMLKDSADVLEIIGYNNLSKTYSVFFEITMVLAFSFVGITLILRKKANEMKSGHGNAVFYMLLKQWLLKEKNINFCVNFTGAQVTKTFNLICKRMSEGSNANADANETISLLELEKEFNSKSVWNKMLLSGVFSGVLNLLSALPYLVVIIYAIKVITNSFSGENVATLDLSSLSFTTLVFDFGVGCLIFLKVFENFRYKWYSVAVSKWCKSMNKNMLDLAARGYLLENVDRASEEITPFMFTAVYYNDLVFMQNFYMRNVFSAILKVISSLLGTFAVYYGAMWIGKVRSDIVMPIVLVILSVVCSAIGDPLKKE